MKLPVRILACSSNRWDQKGDFAIVDSEDQIIAECYHITSEDRTQPSEQLARFIAEKINSEWSE